MNKIEEKLLTRTQVAGIVLATCAVNPGSVTSSCGAVIVVEQTTEAISTQHRTGCQSYHAGRFKRSALLEALVGPSLVVMLDELDQYLFQVSPTKTGCLTRLDFCRPTAWPLTDLVPVAAVKFDLRGLPWEMAFEVDSAGEVSGFEVRGPALLAARPPRPYRRQRSR